MKDRPRVISPPNPNEPLQNLICPVCIDSHVFFSRVRLWERPIVRLTGFRPLRCRRCGWRGWNPDKAAPDENQPAQPPEMNLADKILDRLEDATSQVQKRATPFTPHSK
jgi:hypothetical protein